MSLPLFPPSLLCSPPLIFRNLFFIPEGIGFLISSFFYSFLFTFPPKRRQKVSIFPLEGVVSFPPPLPTFFLRVKAAVSPPLPLFVLISLSFLPPFFRVRPFLEFREFLRPDSFCLQFLFPLFRVPVVKVTPHFLGVETTRKPFSFLDPLRFLLCGQMPADDLVPLLPFQKRKYGSPASPSLEISLSDLFFIRVSDRNVDTRFPLACLNDLALSHFVMIHVVRRTRSFFLPPFFPQTLTPETKNKP